MASPRWLVIPVLVTVAAVAVAACSSGATNATATASSSASGTGGAGGSGGAGGAPGTTSSTGTGGADADAGLVCKTHSYSTIKAGVCDLLQQDCPTGKTCKELKNANNTWTTQCVVANGLKGEGETCGVDDECRAKLTCAAGRCAPVCCGSTNEPCLGGICNLFIQLDNGNKVNKQVCHYAKACDLLTANACDQAFSCHVEDSKQGLATCVQPSGANAPDLGACHYLNDCGDMEHCLDGSPNKAGKCHFYCGLEQADPSSPGAGLGGCPSGQTCHALEVDGVPFDFNLPTIGLCAPGGSSSTSSSASSSSTGSGLPSDAGMSGG
jgi:hypothetical protein